MSYLLKATSREGSQGADLAIAPESQIVDVEAVETQETSKLQNFVGCQKCGSYDQWQAKQSTQASALPIWLCWHCEPPPIKSLVAKRRGPLAETLVVERVKDFMAEFVDGFEVMLEMPLAPLKPVVIAMGAPICPRCSGAWVVESDAGERMKYCCWTCKTEISQVVYLDCFSNPMFLTKNERNKGSRPKLL